MKRLFFVLFSIFTLNMVAEAQVPEQTAQYLWYQWQYGMRQPRIWSDSVMRPPVGDTAIFKPNTGAIMMHTDNLFYRRVGAAWLPIGTGVSVSANEGLSFENGAVRLGQARTTPGTPSAITDDVMWPIQNGSYINLRNEVDNAHTLFDANFVRLNDSANSNFATLGATALTINASDNAPRVHLTRGDRFATLDGDSAHLNLFGDNSLYAGLGVPLIRMVELNTGVESQIYNGGGDLNLYHQGTGITFSATGSAGNATHKFFHNGVVNDTRTLMSFEDSWNTLDHPTIVDIHADRSGDLSGTFSKLLRVRNEISDAMSVMGDGTFKLQPPPQANPLTDSLLWWSPSDSTVKKTPAGSGMWSPTFTDLSGFSAFSSNDFIYSRIGNVVTFSGQVSVTISATGEKYFTFTVPTDHPLVSGTNNAYGTISFYVSGGGAAAFGGYVQSDSGQIFILLTGNTTGAGHVVAISGQYIAQ
jgi:hypothetical protein